LGPQAWGNWSKGPGVFPDHVEIRNVGAQLDSPPVLETDLTVPDREGPVRDRPRGEKAASFDSEAELWRPIAGATVERRYHATALLLPDGRVVSAGDAVPVPSPRRLEPDGAARGEAQGRRRF
jgi:hypothetical protein